ncbi:maestro heat-like repeat-containing protein family member 9 [Herpailurus yagouaroundi]|uniref:maestro heat-like repeat-containing protein family member 9 n=1 Tax=Herpailurus yagouaroundi TaxID=1608482 RepID=UPI001AD79A1B|nr:maestro heat-like repeat-containing protein family member 9 [Puma yagouaroundi]XP_040325248.1 maestro heat-like repeat-containing protein family member 9 [Puma yagouaroundi]
MIFYKEIHSFIFTVPLSFLWEYLKVHMLYKARSWVSFSSTFSLTQGRATKVRLHLLSSLLNNCTFFLTSFVDPSLQFESQLKIIESSFKKVFSIPSLEKVRQMGNSEDDKEDIENLYQNILNMYEDTLLILVSKDLYKLQILKDMAMWMNEDSSYLQERAIVVISRVLSFASRKVRGYVSDSAIRHPLLKAESL